MSVANTKNPEVRTENNYHFEGSNNPKFVMGPQYNFEFGNRNGFNKEPALATRSGLGEVATGAIQAVWSHIFGSK